MSDLDKYSSFDHIERAHLKTILNFCGQHNNPFDRNIPTGHITASAVLTTPDYTQVLMIWHEKLQKWLQPGGHCDLELDLTTQDTAKRELIEETSISASLISASTIQPFDLDVHTITATVDKQHVHYDIRYLYIYKGNLTLKSRDDTSWTSTADLATYPDESLARFARKLMSFNIQQE